MVCEFVLFECIEVVGFMVILLCCESEDEVCDWFCCLWDFFLVVEFE